MFGNRMYDHKCGINMFKVVECRTHRSVPSFVLHQARASHWVTIGHRRTVSRQHSTRSRCQLVSPRTRTNAGVSHLCFSGVNAYNHLPQAIHDLGLAPLKASFLSGYCVMRAEQSYVIRALEMYCNSPVYLFCFCYAACISHTLVEKLCRGAWGSENTLLWS